MNPTNYLLPQPSFDLTPEKQAAFESLLDSGPLGSLIDYQLPYPKWQFLSYLCQSRDLVLHGSQNVGIEIVEPRKASDIKPISAQDAIYATTDGIWAIFFAIVDRKNFGVLTLFNSCLDIQVLSNQRIGPLYFFSISHVAWLRKPWCNGVVYILPRETFEREPAQQMMGVEITFPDWASSKPASPVAKLKVLPQDFPFLADIHGHNDEKLTQLAAADPNGFPWPDALVT